MKKALLLGFVFLFFLTGAFLVLRAVIFEFGFDGKIKGDYVWVKGTLVELEHDKRRSGSKFSSKIHLMLSPYANCLSIYKESFNAYSAALESGVLEQLKAGDSIEIQLSTEHKNELKEQVSSLSVCLSVMGIKKGEKLFFDIDTLGPEYKEGKWAKIIVYSLVFIFLLLVALLVLAILVVYLKKRKNQGNSAPKSS